MRYRIPLPVTQILLYPNGYSYPVCPRCRRCLDREFLRFCCLCGQRLDWDRFADAAVLELSPHAGTK